jgi:hypothetical protein
MRTTFGICSVFALALFLSACGGGDNPNDVPRTVPPAGSDGGAAAATPAKIIKGTGPTIEAIAIVQAAIG